MPAKINNWGLLTGFTIQSPEEPNTKLCGETENYPGEPDGSEICTSRIKGKRSELVCTKNSEYELGEPSARYSRIYPDARNRLLAALKELT